MRRWWWRLAASVAVAAVAVVLWIWSGRGATKDPAETPLLRSSPAGIVAIEVRKPDGASRLARADTGWHLTGVVADLVDSSRVRPLLNSLAAATAGPEIPGADADDRRFGFADPDAVELVLTFRDGQSLQLGMGAQNPVTGHVYARGAGRRACSSSPVPCGISGRRCPTRCACAACCRPSRAPRSTPCASSRATWRNRS